ncbi:hypothetical protein [Frankia sp. QA3]|uniref:hypothetical protein n=1 Tax=Frankia sp. QA3 TaxID=710111 RepID=UPI0018DEE12D|nr:hypothetical protein [Frankia sp. QA3]
MDVRQVYVLGRVPKVRDGSAGLQLRCLLEKIGRQVRKSRLAGLGLAFTISAAVATGTATPASAATESGDGDNASLAALVDWLSTHELQDWLNFLALTQPQPPNASNLNQVSQKEAVRSAGSNASNLNQVSQKEAARSAGSNASNLNQVSQKEAVRSAGSNASNLNQVSQKEAARSAGSNASNKAGR